MDLRNIVSEEFFVKIAHNITDHKDLFLKTPYDLSVTTKMKLKDIDKNLDEVAINMFKDRMKTASQCKKWEFLTTGCDKLDKTLEGGIPINGLTEIYGNSSGGKTQLCLQLALTVQLPKTLGGLNKGAIYICTEETFQSKRLKQMIEHLQLMYPDVDNIEDFDDKIFVEHIGDFAQLKKFIDGKLNTLMSQVPIGLIVIDSIAGCIRGENADMNFIDRSRDFIMLSLELKDLSHKHNCAVVVTNQVADNIITGETGPTLGLAWSNVITSRYVLERNYTNSIRNFKVMFSPNVPQNECQLLIASAGLVANSEI